MIYLKAKIYYYYNKLQQLYHKWRKRGIEFPSCVNIQNPNSTLNHCIGLIKQRIPGGYLRFGDGDIYLMEGKNDSRQHCNAQLSKEMKEAFELGGPGVMKCLQIHSVKYGMSPGMEPGMHLIGDDIADTYLNATYKYFVGHKIYSPIALSYAAIFDRKLALDFLIFIRNYKPIFIGNQDVPDEILLKLFETKQRISTPSRESFSAMDRIYNETTMAIHSCSGEYTVVVVAMGCSGRILQKRIIKEFNNVFVFDFGSLLDAFCGWNTRTWIKISQVDEKYWYCLLNDIYTNKK